MNDTVKLSFFASGEPACKGSVNPVINRNTGKLFVKHQDKRLKGWTTTLAFEAHRALNGNGKAVPPLRGEVAFRRLEFLFDKPKKPAHRWPRKDLDKLIRAVLDALTGVVYVDDSQVWTIEHVTKRYATADQKPGVLVEMEGEQE